MSWVWKRPGDSFCVHRTNDRKNLWTQNIDCYLFIFKLNVSFVYKSVWVETAYCEHTTYILIHQLIFGKNIIFSLKKTSRYIIYLLEDKCEKYMWIWIIKWDYFVNGIIIKMEVPTCASTNGFYFNNPAVTIPKPATGRLFVT